MKGTFLSFAKYNEQADQAVFSILDKLSVEEREKDRGSYYGNLSGLARHLVGGTTFFLGLFKGVLGNNAKALKTLAPLEGLSVPEGTLDGAGWKKVEAAIKTADKVLIDLTTALNDGDFELPISVNWFGGNPPSVPLSFMFQSLIIHGTHHRGQISQVLDSMKIDNDYSGMNPAFLPK